MTTFNSGCFARWLSIALLAGTALTVAVGGAFAADSGPVLRVKPAQHDFGKVVATQQSAPLTVVVTNTSRSMPVTFTSIVAGETFLIQSDKCSGAPLAPGASCKLQVAFHPLVSGNIDDKKALTFTDSANQSPQRVELGGQGVVGSFL